MAGTPLLASEHDILGQSLPECQLYLVGELKLPSPPKPNDKVTAEMTRLRRDRKISPSLTFLDEVDNKKLKIVVHNIQSLRAHHETTKNDSSLMATDVLGFVETRTSRSGNIEFDNFSCAFERICPPYGTSIYVKTDIEAELVVDIAKHNNEGARYIVEVTTIRVRKDDSTTFVTVVYNSPKAPRKVLEEALVEAKQRVPEDSRQVVIGDFNIDREKPEGEKLIQFMRGMSLNCTLPLDYMTTNEGKQIDQCFTNVDNAIAGTGESLISYHKPIWIYF